MKKLLLALLLALLLLPSVVFAEGSSVTWSTETIFTQGRPNIVIHTAAIVSDDAAGTASGVTTMRGKIICVTAFDGATTPTASWDFTLKDALGVDILGSAGTNVSATLGLNVMPLTAASGAAFVNGRPIYGTVTLAASAMGNAKTGTVKVYVEE